MHQHQIGRSTIQTPEADPARAFAEGQAATACVSKVEQATADQGHSQAAVDYAAGPRTIDALTQSQTFWYSSNDEECWQGGPYDTREEAEIEAKANEHRLIMEATKGPIRVSRFFCQASFIEQAEESLYDMANEDGDPLLDFLADVNLDLQARVRAAIDEWQVAHQLSPVAWRFDSTGPVEIAAWAKGGEA